MNKIAKVIIIVVITILATFAVHQVLTEKYADWVSTDGEITDVRFYHSKRRKRADVYSYEIYYTYNVDGKTYAGVDGYMGKESDTDAAAGQAVTVWYDPDDPSSSSFHKPSSGLWPFATFLIGLYLISQTLKSDTQTKKGRKYRVHQQ
ncbi:MAG: DUF3592 domain-containing protein [Oscillospiraceae bacterium]|nr:DUF3592 domain-containing protein [Oscillospiraceae bacterium]